MSTRKRTRKSAISTIQNELTRPTTPVAKLTIVEKVTETPKRIETIEVEPAKVTPKVTTKKVNLNHPSIAKITPASSKDEICTAASEFKDYQEKKLNQFKEQRDFAYIVALIALVVGAIL